MHDNSGERDREHRDRDHRHDQLLVRRSRRSFLITSTTLAAGSALEPGQAQEKRGTGKFVPPNAERRRNAVGSLKNLTGPTKRAFESEELFEPMTAPKRGDWLSEHPEKGQTFDQFVGSRPEKPDARRSTIYLVPFGEFDPEWSPKLSDLEQCASAFFQLPVKSLPPQPLDEKQFTMRENDGRKQFLTKDFLRLLPNLRPVDGFAIVGITMQDLYPDPAWNYVFGQASPRNQTGIYSFARYDPLFWRERRTPQAKELLLLRSLGVLLHETCHMFEMTHCIYYMCLMNGANNMEESDKSPMHLCPVCLRKLQSSIDFDVVARYENLLKEYERLGIGEETAWLKKRLATIRE